MDRIEDEEHEKIAEYCKDAERALDKQSYKRAVKYFGNALEITENLIGKDSKIYQKLEERLDFVKKIPSLKEDRDDIAEDARDALKDGNFHQAYLLYLKASKISKKLVQFDKEEEYRLKAKALNDFAKIDKRFKEGR